MPDVAHRDALGASSLDRQGEPARSARVSLIAQLGTGHRDHIVTHLRSLSAEDRRLRFGHLISDASLVTYVRRIRYLRDAAFGAFDDDGRLLAFGHLSFSTEDGAAELGISVNAAARNQGVGLALLERAAAHARNRGYPRLVMVFMPENKALDSLARRAGMQIVCDPVEPRAYLTLEPASPASMLNEAFGEAVAAIDLGFRLGTAKPAATSA